MATLLEKYSKRIQVAESVHRKSHNGAGMTTGKKLLLAQVIDNTSRFLNEAFTNGAATQRSVLGDYKRFCMNVTNVAMPNLILPDLMLTVPMTSITGYITYMKYQLGVSKGGVVAPLTTNTPWSVGKMTEERINYTSDRVVETLTSFTSGTTKVSWTPVNTDAGYICYDSSKNPITDATIAKDGTITSDTTAVASVAYVYDNIIIPQVGNGTDALPTLVAKMDHIQLFARARRIAIYYDQIAAFQAKTDYGMDLDANMSAQAQGELAYEIDSEGVQMLLEAAEDLTNLHFAKYPETGMAISRSQYYEGFSEVIARAKAEIYRRTNKFVPNFMIVGVNLISLLPYLKNWTPAPAGAINGPYFAGTADSVKVFVTPMEKYANKFVFGVNGSDLQSAAGVYAPYMALVPTQLLGLPDGTMEQGFSTMYDMKLLSTYNVDTSSGTPVRKDPRDGTVGQYSWLLAGGELTSATNEFSVNATIVNTTTNPVNTKEVTSG